MMREALRRLELITMDCLKNAHSPWHLVDMLTQTSLSPDLLALVQETIRSRGWEMSDLLSKIERLSVTLEKRNRKVIGQWQQALK